jgi:hypothetical protein
MINRTQLRLNTLVYKRKQLVDNIRIHLAAQLPPLHQLSDHLYYQLQDQLQDDEKQGSIKISIKVSYLA